MEEELGDRKGNTRWLCFLAIETLYQRASTQELNYCPCLSDYDYYHTLSLASAVLDESRHDYQKQRNKDDDPETDYNHWVRKIFGVSPSKIYLDGSRYDKKPRLKFMPDVDIEIVGLRNISLKCKTRDRRENLRLKLHQLSSDWFDHILQRDKSVYAQFSIVNKHSKLEIDSRDSGGRLVAGEEFQIKITATYKAFFTVFWIDGDKKISDVYPHDEKTEKNHGWVEMPQNDLISVVEIGTKFGFFVHEPEGIDTCVIVVNRVPLSSNEAQEIKNSLKNAIRSAKFKCLGLHGVYSSFVKIPIPQKRPQKSHFGGDDPTQDWQKNLAKAIYKKADTICFWSIPNKQS